MPKRKKRKFGNKLGFGIFYCMIQTGGLKSAYLILYFVAFYYTLFNVSARRNASWYILKKFPNKSRNAAFFHIYKLIVSLGKVLIDSAAASILKPDILKGYISTSDRQIIFDIIKRGRGLILLTSHTGCWQAAFSALRFIPVPLNLLMHIHEDHDQYHLMKQKDGGALINVIDADGFLGGTMEMMKALKKGEGGAIMGDRVLPSSKNALLVSFLGDGAFFPYGAFKIASASNVPVLVIFTSRQGEGSYNVEIADVIDVPCGLGNKKEAYRKYLERYVKALEVYTEKYPYQFFNFYNMWNVS